MSCCVFSLLVIALLYAQYSDPPISSVVSNNAQVASTLSSVSVSQMNCSVISDPPGIASNVVQAAAIFPIGAYPSVDNRISIGYIPQVAWAWGEQHSGFYEWQTSLGGTTCTGSASFVNRTVYPNILYSFKGSGVVDTTPGVPASIPQGVVSTLALTNGSDNLSITAGGIIILTYDIDKNTVVCTESTGCTCEYDYIASGLKNIALSCGSTLKYAVEGGEPLFFLERPILREQWYKNNLFDNAVLSKRRFYKGGISLNGTSVGNFSLRAFNISTDSFGFQKIVSVPQPEFANVSVFEGDIGAVPIPLNSDNSSFAYSYEVNLTAPYSGIGKNNLSLSLSDDFGFAFTTEKEILSRAMTFDGNKSEAGNLVSGDTTNYGKSAKFEFDNFNVGILSLGTIGIILVVALFAKKH